MVWVLGGNRDVLGGGISGDHGVGSLVGSVCVIRTSLRGVSEYVLSSGIEG
jgi:hypothetical protein